MGGNPLGRLVRPHDQSTLGDLTTWVYHDLEDDPVDLYGGPAASLNQITNLHLFFFLKMG